MTVPGRFGAGLASGLVPFRMTLPGRFGAGLRGTLAAILASRP